MGAFDFLYSDYPLDGAQTSDEYQTKDFECRFDAYKITRDGRLQVIRSIDAEEPDYFTLYEKIGKELMEEGAEWEDLNHRRGYIYFYNGVIDYFVNFASDGRLIGVLAKVRGT